MKRKKHNSIISFLLALCIIIGSLGITYNAQADDSSDATWTKIAQNSNGVLGTDAENPADVSFSNYVTAYYNQKITVEEGTRISLKVNYPQTSDGVLLQYAFALVDKVGCFYTSDATANSLMAEMYSAANASTGNGSVSKVSNNTRTWLGSLGSMQEARSTTAVYTIVYEKIDETVDEVNYSWEITMTSATGSQSYMVKASDIPHDMFKNGAYLAAGSMAGSTTHTMNISDLTITRVARWKRIAQNSNAILTSNEEKTADASFTNYVTAYYNQKINIEEGTKISFKVNFSKITENALLQYAFALVDRAGSFYVSDTDANSLMTEMYGAATSSNVYGIASKKLSSATARTWLANLTDIQEAKSTTGVYTIIYEKTNETISGENYSWKITMASATGSQSYMVKASDEEYQGDERIRAFYMQDEWRVARHRLHRPWLAVDKVHTEVIKASPGKEPEKVGVGPGLSFAQHMKEYTKVPQGVICCAHGGTTMAQWNPEIAKDGPDKSLFAAMVRRFKVNGSHVRGMFWYQGCSEAMAHLNEIFFSNMQRFVAATRAEMGMIPIVQVQIGNITVVEREHWDRTWTDIREQQRTMSDEFPLFDTISAISMATDDAVHLSSDSQKSIGKTAAESMYALMMDDKEFLLAPKYKSHKVYSAWMEEYTIIDVEYENVYGELQAEGKPCGFEISNATDYLTHKQVCNISLEGNHVLIRVGRNISQLEDWYLFYGFGVNPYCNITDSHGRRIPAMGPIKVV